jgi:hypothetical protein
MGPEIRNRLWLAWDDPAALLVVQTVSHTFQKGLSDCFILLCATGSPGKALCKSAFPEKLDVWNPEKQETQRPKIIPSHTEVETQLKLLDFCQTAQQRIRDQHVKHHFLANLDIDHRFDRHQPAGACKGCWKSRRVEGGWAMPPLRVFSSWFETQSSMPFCVPVRASS